MAEKTYRTRGQVAPIVRKVEKRLPGCVVCGSWRRGSDRIGDVDVLVVTDNGELPDLTCLADFVQPMSGAKLAGRGLVHLEDGLAPLQLDVYACSPEQRGAFLWFLTGPKNLNIRMRAEARGVGWKLSQYGLLDKAGDQLDDGTEADIASMLGYEALLDPKERDQFAAPVQSKAQEIRVKGSKGDEYVVRIDGHRASCTCPGFKFRRECKHVKSVLEV